MRASLLSLLSPRSSLPREGKREGSSSSARDCFYPQAHFNEFSIVINVGINGATRRQKWVFVTEEGEFWGESRFSPGEVCRITRHIGRERGKR